MCPGTSRTGGEVGAGAGVRDICRPLASGGRGGQEVPKAKGAQLLKCIAPGLRILPVPVK